MANKMFKYFAGTKEQFITKGYPTSHANEIVFIKGGGDVSKSCIFAQGMYFANITELIKAINYVKGVQVGDNQYNAALGGGYIPFASGDNSTVALNVENGTITVGLTEAFVKKVNDTSTNLGNTNDAANSEGSAFARIANLAARLGELTGDEDGGQSIAAQINALRTEIVGNLDSADAKTLQSINDELDGLDTKVKNIEDNYATTEFVGDAISALAGEESDGEKVVVKVTTVGGQVDAVSVDETALNEALATKADLENGKILSTQLPDYILGQVMFGGTIVSNAGQTNLAISPSANFTAKYGNIGTIPAADFAKYEGVYFIAQLDGTFAPNGQSPISYNTGDWIISTGSAWAKIDNTDAVSAVAGLSGAITADALAAALSADGVTGELATKAEVDAVEVTASGDNTLLTASVSNKRAVSVAPTEKLTNAVAKAESAYQKPAIGIGVDDFSTIVQGMLNKANESATSAEGTNFITASISGNELSVSSTTQAVANASSTSKGLAEASDVKAYVDSLWEWAELD